MTLTTPSRAVPAVLFLLFLCSSAAGAADTIFSSNLTFADTEDWSGPLRSLLQAGSLTGCLSGIKFVRKGETGYEDLRKRIDAGAYANRYPNYIISPSSEAQVATTVKCLNQFKTPFVVRSGGHSYRGMSILGCGAIIDMYNMRSISINGGTATLGAGVRLGTLYRTLWLNGKKVFPAGTCPSVGLSGLMLSGGKGLLTRKWSMTVDSLVSARVVLMDGRTVTASASQNSDLFFGIRGGSGSYGIITSWTVKIYGAPKTYTQLEMGWAWSVDTATKVADALFAAKPWDWPENVSVVRLYYQKGKPYPIRTVIHYWGTKAQMQQFMSTSSFFSSAPKYTTIIFSEGQYIDAALRAAAFGSGKTISLDSWTNTRVGSPSSPKSYQSTYVPRSIPSAGNRVIANWVQGGGDVTMTFLGGAVKKFSGSAVDGHRNQLLLIQFSATGTSRESRMSAIRNSFKPYWDGQQYLGYIGAVPSGSNPFNVFFGSKGSFLEGLKKKYDPNNRLGALKLPSCT